MKTLYVHVGTQKTGSSAIQDFCMQNRTILEQNGFLYPILPFRYYGKHINRNGVFLASSCDSEPEETRAQAEQKIFADGMQKIETLFQKWDHIILSDEAIWAAVMDRRKSLWSELKEASQRGGYTVKIIVYLRRQDEYLESIWNQRIKASRFTTPWDTFYKESESYINLDYYGTLSYAAEILGAENIIVRRYDRAFLVGNMAQIDFLDVLGLPLTDAYELDHALVNDKISLNGCEIKRIVNQIPGLALKECRFFGQTMKDSRTDMKQEAPFVLWSEKDARQFVQRFHADNEKLAETFIRDGQPLFTDHYRNGTVWQRENPFMEDDIIRFFSATDLALLREVEALKQQVIDMQKQLDSLQKFRHKTKHPFQAASQAIRRKFN